MKFADSRRFVGHVRPARGVRFAMPRLDGGRREAIAARGPAGAVRAG
ncbi:hypothetical protein [Burkholderia pseudomallei]|nr:hypothetical protein [Burkholderia pseudomallei]